VCQKQKDLTQAVLHTGRQPPNTSLLTIDVMEKMGNDLVRLCDKMEPHGLVDYQMGIWEEEILSGKVLNVLSADDKLVILNVLIVLGQCLDLIEGASQTHPTATGRS
jgi:hypothetical protein